MSRSAWLFFLLFSCGEFLADAAEQWTNWAENQSCSLNVFYPKNKHELVRFMEQEGTKQTIRPVGSGHSWSPLICPTDWGVDLKNLNKILAIDARNHLVTAEAGVTIEELNKRLEAEHLALPNQSAVMEQTLAGIVSTATHGTGHTGTFSSFVREVTIIAPGGKEITASPTENATYFNALATGLGTGGIIYKLTLSCVPQFYLKRSEVEFSKERFLNRYRNICNQHDFVQLVWPAEGDQVIVHIYDKVRKENPQAQVSFEALSSYDSGGKRLEEEIAIPVNLFPQAVKTVENLIRRYASSGYSIEQIFCRFVEADTSFLSMTTGQESVFLSVSTPVDEKYLSFFKEFEESLLTYHGRPHWGKINFLDYQRALFLYGENLSKFIEVKNAIDPGSNLDNPYLKRIFSPEEAAE